MTRQASLKGLGKLSVITLATTLTFAQVAHAQPANPSDAEIAAAQDAVGQREGDVASLATSLTQADGQINSLELTIGSLREAVNKALVDLHDAQLSAEEARRGVTAAKSDLDETQKAIAEAQSVLNEISNSEYRRSASGAGVSGMAGTAATADTLDRQTYLRVNADKQREAITELDRLRTEQANEESRLREARNLAEQREAEAEQARANVQAEMDRSNAELESALREHAELVAKRDQAQSELDAARGTVSDLEQQREAYLAAEEARKKAEEEARKAAEEAARAEAQRQAEAQRAAEEAAKREAEAQAAAAQAAADLVAASQPEHTTTEDPYVGGDQTEPLAAVQAPTQEETSSVLDELETVKLETTQTVTETVSATVDGTREEKIEAVISRAMSQIGTPYAWGGGNAHGPTKGITDGGVADSYGDYNKVGFDCSGLVLYAFAGVGISLPHYSGYQYNMGTKISPSEMQRGDLIFYGPNAEQHVAIYLGDGQMLEAPNSGSTVRISPVRWSGMSPYAVRMI